MEDVEKDIKSNGVMRSAHARCLMVEDEDSALPSTWPSSLAKSGSGAVVVFVDKRSARGAWRSVCTAVKEGKEVVWRPGKDVVVGVQRESLLNIPSLHISDKT